MIKRLKYIFIPVLAVLLMSHIIFTNNVSALTTTLDMSGYGIVKSSNSMPVNCRFDSPVTDVNNTYLCSSNGVTSTTVGLRGIESVEQWNFKTNDLIEFNLVLFSPVSLSALDGFAISTMPVRGGFRLIEFNQIASNVFYNNTSAVTNGTGGTLYEGNSFYSIYHVVFRYLSGDDQSYTIGLPRGNSTYMRWSGSGLSFALQNINQYRFESEGVNKEQAQATQDAADNSSTSGGSSSSDATTATSSLLSVIGTGIGAITTATPTNCKINGNMGNLNIGNIDLCANPVPSFIAVIGSIIAVLVVLPLVIVLFNRFISIFRSFQG